MVNDSVQPVVHALRPWQINIKDQIKAQLDQMKEEVHELTDWVNSLVYSHKKSAELRICLDLKDLNKAIRRCHYQ